MAGRTSDRSPARADQHGDHAAAGGATPGDEAGEAGGAGEGDAGGGLERSIGTWMLSMFVVGNILGAGIYAVVGEVALESGGLLWASFLLAAVLAMFTAGSYAELATKYRRAGGAALYVEKAFGRDWLTVVTAVAVATAAITSAATSARALAADYLPTFAELPVVPVVLVFVALLTAVNWWGISESLKANMVLTAVIVVGLLVVVGVGAWSLTRGDGDLARLTTTPSGGSVWPLAVLGGASLAFFAFVGFEDTAQVVEETRRPARAYPVALGAGIAVTLVLYLLVSASTGVVVAPDDLGGSTAPLVAVVERGSALPGWTVAAIAVVALTNTALLQLVAASRLLYGMSRRELLPPALRTVDPRRRTPVVGIAVVGVVAAVLAMTGGLATLADTTVLLLLTVFVLVNLSVLVLRGDDVDHRHVTVPRLVPLAGATVSGGLAVWSAVTNGLPVVLRYLVLIGLGLAVWFVQRQVAERTDLLDVDDIDGLETTSEPS
jgi:APA family basic amino acid/polyamine antiporter